MSTITPTVTLVGDNAVRFTWATMANSDDGTPIHERWGDFSDRSVGVTGTFGAGGSVRIEGSNDNGSNYFPLDNMQGTDLDITSAKGEQILETTMKTRPRVTAGDGTTSLTVNIFCRRNPK